MDIRHKIDAVVVGQMDEFKVTYARVQDVQANAKAKAGAGAAAGATAGSETSNQVNAEIHYTRFVAAMARCMDTFNTFKIEYLASLLRAKMSVDDKGKEKAAEKEKETVMAKGPVVADRYLLLDCLG